MNEVHPVLIVLEQAREVELLVRELGCKADSMPAELRDKHHTDWHNRAGLGHRTGERLIMLAASAEGRLDE